MSIPILQEIAAQVETSSLDLFSTSRTTKFCMNNAPYICVPKQNGQATLYQACCNDWKCERCGEKRARFEYGRMVVGARELSKTQQLYMMTVTCVGDCSIIEAETEYLNWTDTLHSNVRQTGKRLQGIKPEYAAVVERQGRGHPHTHYLTSFCPHDAFYIVDEYERYCVTIGTLNRSIPKRMRFTPEPLENIDHRQMFSLWLSLACVSAGLGVQVRIAIADLIEGASRYIAKYLFLEATTTDWPKGWRRVRYSHGWPKMPKFEATGAFVVMVQADWNKIIQTQSGVDCFGREVFDRAVRHGVTVAFYQDADGNKVEVNGL